MFDALAAAVESNELHRVAGSEQGLKFFVALISGVANEGAANQPDLRREQDLHNLLTPALLPDPQHHPHTRRVGSKVSDLGVSPVVVAAELQDRDCEGVTKSMGVHHALASPTAMSLALVPVCTHTDQPHSRRTT